MIDTIRIKNPEGSGWLTVKFRNIVTVGESSQIIEILFQLNDETFLDSVPPHFVHPDDHKQLVEFFEGRKN